MQTKNASYIMCLSKLVKTKSERGSTKQTLSVLVDYGASFTCSHNKKRHLVIRGSIHNCSNKPVEIRTRILPKGRLMKSIAKPKERTPLIYDLSPQMIVSATITDAPYSIAASSKDPLTMIVADFNMYDKIEISMSYECGTLIVPIDPNDFVAKQI